VPSPSLHTYRFHLAPQSHLSVQPTPDFRADRESQVSSHFLLGSTISSPVLSSSSHHLPSSLKSAPAKVELVLIPAKPKPKHNRVRSEAYHFGSSSASLAWTGLIPTPCLSRVVVDSSAHDTRQILIWPGGCRRIVVGEIKWLEIWKSGVMDSRDSDKPFRWWLVTAAARFIVLLLVRYARVPWHSLSSLESVDPYPLCSLDDVPRLDHG